MQGLGSVAEGVRWRKKFAALGKKKIVDLPVTDAVKRGARGAVAEAAAGGGGTAAFGAT
jgi:hypothetical protein